MLLQKFRNFAQTIGFVVIGILMAYGAVAAIKNIDGVFAANPGAAESAAPNAPAEAPQLQAASDAVPTFLNYQGTLRDPEGNLMDGVYEMTFRIYGDVTAPTTEAKWEDIYNEVTVRDGRFSVVLGDSTPLPEDAFTSPDRFIGVTVAPYDEMVPRQRFASVPYAMYGAHSAYAEDANLLDGQDGNFYAQRVHSHNSLDGLSNGAPDAVWVSQLGYVGIGTKIPTAQLHIKGPGSGLLIENDTNSIEIFGNNLRTTGDMNIVATGNSTIDMQGNVNVEGGLSVNSQKPILIKRFSDIGNDRDLDTGIPVNTYNCVAGGWAAKYDINENGSNVNMVWTYAGSRNWRAVVRFASHNDHENTDIDIICFRVEISEFDGVKTDNTPD